MNVLFFSSLIRSDSLGMILIIDIIEKATSLDASWLSENGGEIDSLC